MESNLLERWKRYDRGIVIVVDTETTGLLDDAGAVPIELGAVALDLGHGEVLGQFSTLIRPDRYDPADPCFGLGEHGCGIARKIAKIDPVLLEQAPRSKGAIRALFSWVGEFAGPTQADYTAYNVAFDAGMLYRVGGVEARCIPWGPCLMEAARDALRPPRRSLALPGVGRSAARDRVAGRPAPRPVGRTPRGARRPRVAAVAVIAAWKLRGHLLVELRDYGAATTTQLADRYDTGTSRAYGLLRSMEVAGLVERVRYGTPRPGEHAPGVLWQLREGSREPRSRCSAIMEDTTPSGRPRHLRCGWSEGHEAHGQHFFAFHQDPGRRRAWRDGEPGASYLGRKHGSEDHRDNGSGDAGGDQPGEDRGHDPGLA